MSAVSAHHVTGTGGIVFGLELQTSQNFFINGVKDREVAYRHDSNLMTLEGDETTSGEASELEFVTAPCRAPDQAQEAVGYAAALATDLGRQASKTSDWVLTFKKGDRLLGGTWLKDCQIGIGDSTFVANPQGTVGISLAKLKPFIEQVLHDLGEEGPGFLSDLKYMRQQSGLDFERDEHRELIGFLTACHIFLVWATWANVPAVAVGPDGVPRHGYDGNMYRIFAFKNSPYLKSFPEPGTTTPAFERNGECRVVVCRDSPKSQFKLLHRTDFCSMFRELPAEQRDRLLHLPVREDNVPEAVWPKAWGDRELFTFPYRADPPDPIAVANGEIKQYPPEGWPGDKATRKQEEHWWLMEHGPLLSDWWKSVVLGRPVPGGPGMMPKDLASPPPGMRGRNPDRIADFPGDDENKRDYYGMGAFPMDRSAKPRLAVYEHRAFADYAGLQDLGTLSVDKWGKIVEVFCKQYVIPFA